MERETTKTIAYSRGSIPLSSLARVYTDAGGRTVSNLDFMQINLNTKNINSVVHVSFNRVGHRTMEFVESFPTVVSGSSILEADSLTTLYRVSDGSVVRPHFKYPHLYEMIVHVQTTVESLIPFDSPTITVVSVTHDDNFQTIGTQGSLSAYPYTKEGIYFGKKAKSPYEIGTIEGAALYLGDTTGVSVLDGSVTVSGRRLQTFLGLQMWIKFTGGEGTIELDIEDQLATFYIQASGDRATLGEGLSTIDSTFTMYQDGQKVRTPTLYKDVWTSIGISLNSPVEISTGQPELNFSGGAVYKNILFYGGDALSKLINFRTWAQVAFNGTDLHWDDWDEVTWKEVFTFEGNVPAMNIGKQYLGTIGANRYVVGEDEGEDSRTLVIIDAGTSIVSKEIRDSGSGITATRSVISTPSWRAVGTYSA